LPHLGLKEDFFSRKILVIKKRLNSLSKTSFRPSNGLKIVMGDENYFSLSGENMPGNDGD
jgi:hypothetical protein